MNIVCSGGGVNWLTFRTFIAELFDMLNDDMFSFIERIEAVSRHLFMWMKQIQKTQTQIFWGWEQHRHNKVNRQRNAIATSDLTRVKWCLNSRRVPLLRVSPLLSDFLGRITHAYWFQERWEDEPSEISTQGAQYQLEWEQYPKAIGQKAAEVSWFYRSLIDHVSDESLLCLAQPILRTRQRGAFVMRCTKTAWIV